MPPPPRRRRPGGDAEGEGREEPAAAPRPRFEAVIEPGASHVSIGAGTDLTIAELAAMVAEITGFRAHHDAPRVSRRPPPAPPGTGATHPCT